MQQAFVKICPSCGAEHVLAAEKCLDCDVVLELGEAGGATGEPEADALPPATELAPVVTDRAAWELERMALVLQEAGIPCRIETHPLDADVGASGSGGTTLCIYVLPADRDAAIERVQEHRAASLPGDHEPARFGQTLEACPACGTPLTEGAEECADCGLEFPSVEVD